jgi:hypothetical protein
MSQPRTASRQGVDCSLRQPNPVVRTAGGLLCAHHGGPAYSGESRSAGRQDASSRTALRTAKRVRSRSSTSSAGEISCGIYALSQSNRGLLTPVIRGHISKGFAPRLATLPGTSTAYLADGAPAMSLSLLRATELPRGSIDAAVEGICLQEPAPSAMLTLYTAVNSPGVLVEWYVPTVNPSLSS